MSITTLSSQEFNQDNAKAKQAAKRGPVFITNRSRPAHVLISIEQYQSLAGSNSSTVDLLASPGAEKIEFTAPQVGKLTRPAKLE